MNNHLQHIANTIRLNTFKAIANAGGGHFGGALSELEILTVLYFCEMNIDPEHPDDMTRDRFILSKGHGGPGLYATLAERGYFPVEWLKELDKNGSKLPKHIDRFKLPGLDASSGSLGQGLSIGTGMALAAKLDRHGIRVYVLIGDGECNEGQIWEAAMTASKYHLDNLTGIIDWNGMQVDGNCDVVMPNDSIAARWEAFGWHVLLVDGHDVQDLQDAFRKARMFSGKPSIIIASTIKGKGVSFMEGRYEWHNSSVSTEQLSQAITELEERLSADT